MTEYVPGQAGRVYMAVNALTEEEAVTALTEQAALFYGADPDQIGLVITSAEQADSEQFFTLGNDEPVRTETRFSVEGYAYVKEVR